MQLSVNTFWYRKYPEFGFSGCALQQLNKIFPAYTSCNCMNTNIFLAEFHLSCKTFLLID